MFLEQKIPMKSSMSIPELRAARRKSFLGSRKVKIEVRESSTDRSSDRVNRWNQYDDFLMPLKIVPLGVLILSPVFQECSGISCIPLVISSGSKFTPWNLRENLQENGFICLPNVRDDGSPHAFGMAPAREAESAGGVTKVPKAW